MQNHIALLALLFAVGASVPAAAGGGGSVAPAGRSIGFGFELGAPTSIGAKFMTGDHTGIVVGVGGGIWYDASLSLHVDHLWHPIVSHFDSGSFSAYVGIGGWASIGYEGSRLGYYAPYSTSQPVSLGLRVPLGVSLAFNELPIELFAEVVPSVVLFPGIGGFGQGGIGARFYF